MYILDIYVDINVLCSWNLNQSILKGLNEIRVHLRLSHFKAVKFLLLDEQNKRQQHFGVYSCMMSIYTIVSS